MLTNENLSLAEDGIWWIRSSRKKTGVDFEIPLMELPLHIIEKYRDVAPEGKLLPMYSNSSLNHYLKQIAVLCGIERKLVFHKARHNFGTHITLSMGIPIETVGKMMGHMRIETTQLYAKVTDKKVDEDMKRLKAAGLSQTSGLYEEDIIVRKQRRKSQSQLSENKETTL